MIEAEEGETQDSDETYLSEECFADHHDPPPIISLNALEGLATFSLYACGGTMREAQTPHSH